MGKFKELVVWQRAKDLSVFVYKVSSNSFYQTDRSLQDQMRRCAVSIPSNIAEGDEAGSNKQSVRYFNISKGSAAELTTQTIISYEIGYIAFDDHNHIVNECSEISKMLNSLIRARS